MTTQPDWYVCDESEDRPGYCCLAIRKQGTDRLVADLADVPNDIPGLVDRAWEDARVLAASRDLLAACKKAVADHDAVPTCYLPFDTMNQIRAAIAMAEGHHPNSRSVSRE